MPPPFVPGGRIMSRKKPENRANPKTAALIYLILAMIWTASALVNYSQGYVPLAILYTCLGILFIVMAVLNYLKYRKDE